MRINRRPSMEKQLVEADAGTNRDTGDGRRAFRAPINDVFINVYEPISDFVSPWLSSGFQWFKGCGCHSGSAVHPSRFTTSSFKALFTHYKRRGTIILLRNQIQQMRQEAKMFLNGIRSSFVIEDAQSLVQGSRSISPGHASQEVVLSAELRAFDADLHAVF